VTLTPRWDVDGEMGQWDCKSGLRYRTPVPAGSPLWPLYSELRESLIWRE
jgi:hypothetical protein